VHGLHVFTACSCHRYIFLFIFKWIYWTTAKSTLKVHSRWFRSCSIHELCHSISHTHKYHRKNESILRISFQCLQCPINLDWIIIIYLYSLPAVMPYPSHAFQPCLTTIIRAINLTVSKVCLLPSSITAHLSIFFGFFPP